MLTSRHEEATPRAMQGIQANEKPVGCQVAARLLFCIHPLLCCVVRLSLAEGGRGTHLPSSLSIWKAHRGKEPRPLDVVTTLIQKGDRSRCEEHLYTLTMK